MRIHYFQHDDYEDLAYIGEWAEERGHQTTVTRFDRIVEFPAISDIDWLVVMGGKMGVNDEEKFPWLLAEKQYIRNAIAERKILLGICLGAQLIANVLGSTVYENTGPEIGFFPVKFNEKYREDSVFRHFPRTIKALHLHNDTFQLPDGAIGMASSELTALQAFRFSENVFALQFHFEVTEASLLAIIQGDNNQLPAGQWIQSSDDILKYATICKENNVVFGQILDAIASQREVQFPD